MKTLGIAFLAALRGLLLGALATSALGTVFVLLRPGTRYASFEAFLRAPPSIFLEGLFWGLLGGGLFVLPPAVVFLALYAKRRAPDPRMALDLTAALYAPLLYFNVRSKPVYAACLLVSVHLGVRTSLRYLEERLGRTA